MFSLTKKRFLDVTGKALAFLFSMSCGMTNVYAVFLIINSPLAYIVAPIMFIAVIAMNYKMLNKSVPEVLISIFGGKYFLQGLLSVGKKSHSTSKKILILFGFICAFTAGLSFGALNYIAVASVINSVCSISFLATVLASIFLLITVACITCLMFKSIVQLIQANHILEKSKKFFINLFDMNPNLQRHQNKSTLEIYFLRFLHIMLLLILIPISIMGLIMTTKVCANGINQLLHTSNIEYIPTLVSEILAFGVGMIGQIPFVLKTTIMAVSGFFEKPDQTTKSEALFMSDKLFAGGILLLRIIFAVGNGIIAMLSAQDSITRCLAASGGMVNSFASTTDDIPIASHSSTKIKTRLTKDSKLSNSIVDNKILPAFLPTSNPNYFFRETQNLNKNRLISFSDQPLRINTCRT